MEKEQNIHSYSAPLYILLIGLFTIVSLFGMPFSYDGENSGRYLLQVLQASDTDLFADDPVVESLSRFKSLFYDLIGTGYQITNASPLSLESTMYILYILSKVVLFILIFGISRTLSKDIWVFIILAAWCCYKQGAPIGGEALFVNSMIHSTVAILFGMGALYYLFNKKPLGFWSLLSLGMLMHPLVSLHLAACTVPVLLLAPGRAQWFGWKGVFLFASSLIFYFLWMAPPSMSPEESRIFLEAKGQINHISPFTQGWSGWTKTTALIVLALLALHHFKLESEKASLIAKMVGIGSVIAILLGFAAVTLQWARLAQFQPMRIFVWVTFLTYLLLILVTAKALRIRSVLGPILLIAIAFSILPSLWGLAFSLLGLVYLCAIVYSTSRERFKHRTMDRMAVMGTLLIVTAIGFCWMLREVLPLDTFRTPLPVAACILLVVVLYTRTRDQRAYAMSLVALVSYTLLGGAIHWHRYYDEFTYPEWGSEIYKSRHHPDWEAMQRWCTHETSKHDRFIVAGGYENFRTRSLRTVIGEPMSALAWVDPLAYNRNVERSQRVQEGFEEGAWDLDYLVRLAHEWNTRYVILNGSYKPTTQPLLQIGTFSVFDLNRL